MTELDCNTLYGCKKKYGVEGGGLEERPSKVLTSRDCFKLPGLTWLALQALRFTCTEYED